MINIINGSNFIDDRGTLSFVNDFKFTDVKRFYQVENHSVNFIRAWHGHKIEAKYVYVVSGAILFGAVPLDDMTALACHKVVLSSNQPRILHVPAGYANGFKTLTDKAIVQFFSTTTLEESKNDDYRFDHDVVDIWKENYR